MHRHRLATAFAAAAVLAVGLVSVAPEAGADSSTVAVAKKAKPRFTSYVAMGDSYSATGIAPVVAGPGGSECGRGDAIYSHLVAKALKVEKFKDVACGGADTSDYFAKQYADIPAQIEALRPSTQLVTMTIGGNDDNTFGGAIMTCVYASVASLNTTGSIEGAPCKAQVGNQFRRNVRTVVYPNVLHALQEVRKRAPEATVAILGYPTILPATGVPSCYPSVPLSMGDVPFLGRLQRTLNRVIERAADKTGVRYVDLAGISRGHDACQPIGTRYIEPIRNNVSTAVHPNVLGHQAMAARLLKALK